MYRILDAIKPFARYFLVVWIVIMLTLTSLPHLPEINLIKLPFNLKFDKLAHFSEYSILSLLSMLTFTKGVFKKEKGRIIIVISLMILFAFADECHQLLIPTRSFELYDLLSDTLGILTGAAFVLIFTKYET